MCSSDLIHATGDSWHESRPGILHAYDADDINHELWNSLQNPSRDDCNNYSKMAPPTIANGKVYLSSFGGENTGTGQFCVYGRLPSGALPAAPTSVSATKQSLGGLLLWAPFKSSSRVIYRVGVAEPDETTFRTIAFGLTTPAFLDHSAMTGHTYRYVITAVDANGESMSSAEAVMSLEKPRSSSSHVAH